MRKVQTEKHDCYDWRTRHQDREHTENQKLACAIAPTRSKTTGTGWYVFVEDDGSVVLRGRPRKNRQLVNLEVRQEREYLRSGKVKRTYLRVTELGEVDRAVEQSIKVEIVTNPWRMAKEIVSRLQIGLWVKGGER